MKRCFLNTAEKKKKNQTSNKQVESVVQDVPGCLQEAEYSRPFMLKSHTCIKPEALKSSCGDLVPEILGERSDNIRLYTLFRTCQKIVLMKQLFWRLKLK